MKLKVRSASLNCTTQRVLGMLNIIMQYANGGDLESAVKKQSGKVSLGTLGWDAEESVTPCATLALLGGSSNVLAHTNRSGHLPAAPVP